MENKAHALAAGAFVLLVSALLVAMAWWLSREGGVRVELDWSAYRQGGVASGWVQNRHCAS